MNEEIKVGSIVECWRAGYWQVEIIRVNALDLKPLQYRLRLVMTSKFKPVKNSKKSLDAGARDVALVTTADFGVLRRTIEYGLKHLEQLVKGASNG